MDDKKVEMAIAEAKRFLERAEAYKENRGYGPKENGALRRSSMDLTRALSDMRASK